MRAIREKVTLRNESESHAWIRFAAGAATGIAGESDDIADDAGEAAAMADALLVQYRKRCNK